MKLIGVEDAAGILGISGRRVRALIAEGKLPATFVGGGYVIEEDALKSVQVYGKPGRPPKKAAPSPDGKVIVKKSSKKRGRKAA